MEKYGSGVPLRRFRKDALHRDAMCTALADDEPRHLPVAEQAAGSVTRVDAKAAEIQRGEDVLVRARAVERARRLHTALRYDEARRDLAAAAVALVPTLLPTPPSALRRAGIKRVVAMVTSAVEKLRLPETPEEVRTEHLPMIERELARLNAADVAEDLVAASFAALRAALRLFKADLEAQRVAQYADLLKIAGSRTAADEFFLPAHAPAGEDDAEEPSSGPSGGSSGGT